MRISMEISLRVYHLLWLLQGVSEVFSSFERVETGHQNIAIDGRDPYNGHYTQIHFHDQTCVIGLHLHCLKELTGAEEIDILYSECEHGHWKVAHYTNSKSHFRLQKPILAKKLSISSRNSLTIIDVQVESCPNETLPTVICHGHARRHSKNGQIIRVEDEQPIIRDRRSASLETNNEISTSIEETSHRRSKRNAQNPPKIYEVRKNLILTINEGDNLIKSQAEPYQSGYIIVKSGENLTIDAGTIIEFEPNMGIIVQANGTLHLDGQVNKPIVLMGKPEGIWRGITIQPEGRLTMKNTEIHDPAIGVWMDSDKISIEGGRILRAVVHGIEISKSANDVVDLGELVVEMSLGTAIEVDETNEGDNVRIENAKILNSAGIGIDFALPTGDLELHNIEIQNSGTYSIRIIEFPSRGEKETFKTIGTVQLSNITVFEQTKGHAAVFIQGSSIKNLIIDHSTFTRNTVPSLIIDFECTTTSPSTVRITNSKFSENLDSVVYIMMGECGNLGLRQNSFEKNNADGQKGVLSINTQTQSTQRNYSITENQFLGNTGEYTVHLGGEPGKALFSGNILEENMNSQGVIMLETSAYNITENAIINPRSQYQIGVDFKIDRVINLTNNDWGMDEEADIKDAINFNPDQQVNLLPISQNFESPPRNRLDFTSEASQATPLPNPLETTRITTKRSVNAGRRGCAHLNYCSGKGQCVDNICICNMGYIGFNCSIPIGCECSEHGICDIFNRCNCMEGWTGKNCTEPICRNNCSNNGRCIDRNKCECNAGWTGELCNEPHCHASTCEHGKCEGPTCVCQNGWMGTRCQIPSCSNCSLNGHCTAPDVCSCFEGFGGKDCSTCVSQTCQACDFDCDHGSCDAITGTCICHNNWAGGACDLCPSGKCQQTSRVFYIQPSAGDRQDINTVVSVYGIEFPKTTDNVYSCMYGTTIVRGLRISSGLVRCPTPGNMTSGRHIFNIAPGNSQTPLESMDRKVIHFTFYDSCVPTLCKGTCIGPQCICPSGVTGLNCEVIEVTPVLDFKLLENQKISEAQEGTPYIIMLPTMLSSVVRINSTIKDLKFDSSRGIIEWDDPIGADEPQNITATVYSPAGESQLTWNVTVIPSYSASINNVTVSGRNIIVTGNITRNGNLRKAPVILRFQKVGSENVDEIRLETETDGTFKYEFVPPEESTYSITASHPNASPTQDPLEVDLPQLHMHLDGEATSSGLSISVDDQEHCTSKLIRPPGSGIQVTPKTDGLIIQHNFTREYTGEVVATLKCDEQPMEIIRTDPHDTPAQPYPREFAIFQDERWCDVYKIILPTSKYPITAPLNLELKPPLFLISSSPSISDYEDFRKTDLTLYLGINRNIILKENSTLVIEAAGQPIFTIPYTFVGLHQDYVTVRICARNEMDGINAEQDSYVSIALTNFQLNTAILKENVKVNVQWVDFTLMPGIYQLEAHSPNHLPYSAVVEISPLNTSFCVPLTIFRTDAVPTVLDNDNHQIALLPMSKAELLLPSIFFEPSSIDTSTQRVRAIVRGGLGGTVGLWNSQLNGVRVEPSVRSAKNNESLWINFDGIPNELRISENKCDAALVKVPYLFVPDDLSMASNANANIIMQKSMGDMLCDENGQKIPLAKATTVLCQCGEGARAKCRARYRSATACGDAWQYIPDDTVSLEVLASFIRLAAQCKIVNVQMSELRTALECTASIESECPISRSKREAKFPESDSDFEMTTRAISKRQAPGIFRDLPSINSMSSVLPVLNALDTESIRLASYYIDFIDKLEAIIPSAKLSEINRAWLDAFSMAIGDNSPLGEKISIDEINNLGDGIDLAILWNFTVADWSSGKLDGTLSKPGGVPYEDMKNLVLAADKLKNFARQNGASDPFKLLHDYVGRILLTNGDENEVCATASVLVQPSVIEEGQQIAVSAYVENQRNEPLTNLGLTLDFVRSDPLLPVIEFALGNGFTAGIGSINGLGTLDAKGAFEVHWTRSPVITRRLTSDAKFEPIIILSFDHNGKSSMQKLKASTLTIRPRKTLRAMILIPLPNIPNLPFSLMTSIINPGYTQFDQLTIDYTAFEFRVDPGKYTVESITVDGIVKSPSLSIDMDDLRSGGSKMIKMILQDPNGSVAPVFTTKLQAIADGRLQPFESVDTYEIKAAPSENGFLLAPPGLPTPLFYFRPASGSLVNIIQLTYKAYQPVNSTSNTSKTYVVAYANQESPGFNGALMGSFVLPEDVPNDYTLSQMIELRGNTRIVQPLIWIEDTEGDQNQEEGRILHFIDSGAALPNPQVTYEMTFDGASELNKAPNFRQDEYRIQIMPDDWPLRGTVIGVIPADGQNLTYYIYSQDNQRRFTVDKDTGNIFIESSEVAGEEYCLVLEAVDKTGRKSQVPVAINTGGDRKSCILFNTEGLSPLVHVGETNIFPTTNSPTGDTEGTDHTYIASSDANWPPITNAGETTELTTTTELIPTEVTQSIGTGGGGWTYGSSEASTRPISEPTTEETIGVISSEGTLATIGTTMTPEEPSLYTEEPIEVSTPPETEYTVPTGLYSGETVTNAETTEAPEPTNPAYTFTPDSQLTAETVTEPEETLGTQSQTSSNGVTLTPVGSWWPSSQEPITHPETVPTESTDVTVIHPIFTTASTIGTEESTEIYPSPTRGFDVTTTSEPHGSGGSTLEPEPTRAYTLPTDSSFETISSEPIETSSDANQMSTIETIVTTSTLEEISTIEGGISGTTREVGQSTQPQQRPSTTTNYYQGACSRKDEPIWEIICSLSRSVVEKNRNTNNN